MPYISLASQFHFIAESAGLALSTFSVNVDK